MYNVLELGTLEIVLCEIVKISGSKHILFLTRTGLIEYKKIERTKELKIITLI